LQTDRDHYVQFSAEEADATSAYTLTLTTWLPEPLGWDEPAEPGDEGQTLWWFDGVPGQIVSITVESKAGDANLSVVLMGPQGREIARARPSDEGLRARIPGHVLSMKGRHVIRVEAQDGIPDYRLVLSQLEPKAIELGSETEGNTEELCVWSFQGKEGETVSVSVRALDPELDPTVRLLDEGGKELEYDDDTGKDVNALIDAIALPEDSRYLVVVGHGRKPGAYALLVTSRGQ
jgi:hypothetical protein